MAARIPTIEEIEECDIYSQQLEALGIDPDDPKHLEKFIEMTRNIHQCSPVRKI